MALAAGSISVSATDGSYTGSGLAKAILDEYVAQPKMAAALSGVSGTAKGAAVGNLAELCTAVAAGVVAHVVANAAVTVTIGAAVGGLQKTPNPNNADTATAGPGADQTLPGTVT